MSIIGSHAIVFAQDAERARAFFRDVLGFAHVDAGEGWLIFRLPPAELGIHPTDEADSGRHEVYLMCDDIDGTIQELTAKGVEFAGPVTSAGFGRLATLRIPGGGELSLYEPRHPLAIDTPQRT